jgi:thiamine pyrophosphate-dependent acetolactate synthase large subunit-like protein
MACRPVACGLPSKAEPGNTDVLAQGLGLKSFTIKPPEELDGGVDHASADEKPVFLGVNTEARGCELPPAHSGQPSANRNSI